jgi:GT2 family glycosyltransferase
MRLLKVKVACNVQILSAGLSAKEVVDKALADGFGAICVVDNFTANGAWMAKQCVKENNLSLCVVPGATVGITDGGLVAVIGAVDNMIVPSNLSKAVLKMHVEAAGGMVADLPYTVEIDVDSVTPQSIIEALKAHNGEGSNTAGAYIRQVMGGASGFKCKDLAHPALSRVWKEEVSQFILSRVPSVTVVIPVFNSPELLKRCLESLERTMYPGTLVLVNNASDNEETMHLLHQSSAHKVHLKEPHGFSAAVNAGMRWCPADYYVLLNQDTEIVDPMWLSNLLKWMELRPQCGIAGAKLLFPNETLQHTGIEIPPGTIGRHRHAGLSPDSNQVNYYEKVRAVTGACFCIRAKMVDQIGMLDEDYTFSCEDTAYCLWATMLGWEVWYVPDSVVIHKESAVRKDRTVSPRLQEWIMHSQQKLRREWGAWIDNLDEGVV